MKESINYLEENLKVNDIVVVGCSGGPDSMALLNLLINYRKRNNIFIICAHVDHNVRKESHDEMLFVENYCKKNDIKFETMTITNYGDDNFENEARNIRYNYFEEIINKYNANYLMTAHHGDDLMETILMRIVRGSTLSGYSGFSSCVKKSNYTILRPLIFSTKDEILEYNRVNNIPYVIDKTNFTDEHTRNRYRKNVLPFLKLEDKNVHSKFLKYSKTLNMYVNYIDIEVLKLMNDKNIVDNGVIRVSSFIKLDEVMQNRIIYKILENFYQDDLFLITDVHVDLIKNLIKSNKANSFAYLPNSVKVVKSYDDVYISASLDLFSEYDIELDDIVYLPNGKCIEIISNSDCNNNYFCRLSLDDIKLPLSVRTRRLGDKMVIKNMTGSKKLKDIFIDCKVPIKDRDTWPIVVDASGKIVWLPGLKKSKFDVPKDKKCDIIIRYY